MEGLYIDLGKDSYNIRFSADYTEGLKQYTEIDAPSVIITDSNVDALYGKAIAGLLGAHQYKYVIPQGETSKSIDTVTEILHFMLDKGFNRSSRVIAFGGGVVGDISGFVASIFMRGIDFYQIPTTLLAQVDSSVGGKTGINFPQGKNLVGSFYQPKEVLMSPSLLATLPKRELTSGIAEVIKYGVIYDYNFLKYIKESLKAIYSIDTEVLKQVIRRCCEIKAAIVTEDEKELGLRKILNFGHTFGHAVEALTGYAVYTHGEAVMMGMYHEAAMAKALDLIEETYFCEIAGIIGDTGISTDLKSLSLDLDAVVTRMSGDKKNRAGKISFILPIARGKVQELLLTTEEIKGLILV